MKKLKFTTITIFSCLLLTACQQEPKSNSTSCEAGVDSTIKNPNHSKPMALMMRALANTADSIRVQLLADKTVDMSQYPLIKFWTVEPTDSSVLEPLFFENAKAFEAAYQKLIQEPQNQKENYQAVIHTCIQCHSTYCSGPLKRIRKLPLDYVGK